MEITLESVVHQVGIALTNVTFGSFPFPMLHLIDVHMNLGKLNKRFRLNSDAEKSATASILALLHYRSQLTGKLLNLFHCWLFAGDYNAEPIDDVATSLDFLATSNCAYHEHNKWALSASPRTTRFNVLKIVE